MKKRLHKRGGNHVKKKKKLVDKIKAGLCGFIAFLMILSLFQQLYLLFI